MTLVKPNFDTAALSWQTYTPFFGTSAIGDGTLNGSYQVVGSTMNLRIHLAIGTTTDLSSIKLLFGLPDGYEVDVTKLPGGAIDELSPIGTVHAIDQETATWPTPTYYNTSGVPCFHDVNTITIRDDNGNYWNANAPFTWSFGGTDTPDYLELVASFPVAEVAVAWSPKDIDGLVLWVDPDDNNTVELSGSDVVRITSKANNVVFTVPAGANAPADSTHTTGDGRVVGALLFDDANTEALVASQTDFATAGPFTAIAIALSDDDTADQYVFSIANSASDNSYWGYRFAGASTAHLFQATVRDSLGNTSTFQTTGSAVVANEPTVFQVTEASATSRSLGLDGGHGLATDINSRVMSGCNRYGLGVLARSSLAQYWSGKILAVLVYNRALSDAELALVEDWAWRQKIHNPGVGIPAVGLVLDLDPSVTSSLTITSSPDVDAIANRAGKGITSLTQATAANKPHLDSLNGRGALLFNGTSHRMANATTIPASPSGLSVLGAIQINGAGSSAYPPIVSCRAWTSGTEDGWAVSASGGGSPFLSSHYDDGVADGNGWDSVNGNGQISAAQGSAGVFAMVFDPTKAYATRSWNGTTSTSGTLTYPVTAPAGPSTWIGAAQTSARYLDATVGRLLVYKRALTAAERTQAEATLSADWGIA